MYKYLTGVGSENYLMEMAGNGSSSCSPTHIYPLSYVTFSYHISSLCRLTTLIIHISLSLSLPAQNLLPSPTIVSLPASGLTPRCL